MHLVALILLLAIGLTVTIGGAELLVRGAATLARRLGVSAFAVGLTVVAFGTSAPELVVAIEATLAGQYDITIGNVVGSNIANVALILGLTALVFPIACSSTFVAREVVLMLITTGAAVITLWDNNISRAEGGLLLIGFCAFTYISYTRGKAAGIAAVPGMEEEIRTHGINGGDGRPRAGPVPWLRDAAYIGTGLAMLVFGGNLVVNQAIGIAEAMGISQRVVALSIIAPGTSLPELVVGLVAAFRKHPEIVIGNVIGSNIFNLLLVLAAAAVIHPLSTSGPTWMDLLTMVGMSLACLPIMLAGGRITRAEGVILFACYVTYLAAAYAM